MKRRRVDAQADSGGGCGAKRRHPYLPGAAARNVTNSVKSYHILSVIIALSSGLSGLFLSYELNSATGATIVVFAAIIYFVTLILKPRMIK